jgi:hypothetical protein
VSLNGEFVRGIAPIGHRPVARRARALRPIAYGGGSSFWAAPASGDGRGYVIEEWTVTGELRRVIRREVPWLTMENSRPAPRPSDRPAPFVESIHADTAGFVTTFIVGNAPPAAWDEKRALSGAASEPVDGARRACRRRAAGKPGRLRTPQSTRCRAYRPAADAALVSSDAFRRAAMELIGTSATRPARPTQTGEESAIITTDQEILWWPDDEKHTTLAYDPGRGVGHGGLRRGCGTQLSHVLRGRAHAGSQRRYFHSGESCTQGGGGGGNRALARGWRSTRLRDRLRVANPHARVRLGAGWRLLSAPAAAR